MRLAYAYHVLNFKEPSGTSRGILFEKPTFFIKIWDESNPDIFGIGEAAVFPGLSPEANESFGSKMLETLANVALGLPTDLSGYSSIQFGLEQAILDFSNGGHRLYFPSVFTCGESCITINGLIWMGDYETMLHRIESKLKDGFKCLKLKIGGIGFEEELSLLRVIRERFNPEELELRLDANGAFSPDNAIERLDRLSEYTIHSIEQPIKAGQIEEMARICRISPIPVALDEELIGVANTELRVRLLEDIHPSYIILKPALCGGFSGANEWIEMAKARNIGWWITSALESNIGLNALAQWVGSLGVEMPQGLGTGALYTNNLPSPLVLTGDKLKYDKGFIMPPTALECLDWRY